VSYLFGGKRSLDLERVLEKLRREFGIEKLLLEGGGKINGSFLAADLVDELSVLVVPIADGAVGTPSLFDRSAGEMGGVRRLKLVAFERRAGDALWMRYRVQR
jgi:riboflavin biosynthesis pyrimidine reductase